MRSRCSEASFPRVGEDAALVVFREQSVQRRKVSVSGLLAKRLATKSDRTREAYGRDLQAFADFVQLDVDDALAKLCATETAIAQDVVLGYQASLADAGFSHATINRRISALRSVLKIARSVGITDLRLEAVDTLDTDVQSRDVRGPGIAIVRKILELCDADPTPRGIRDGRILRWFIGTALRRSELRQLTLEDLRRTPDGWVVWIKQKGTKKKVPATVEDWVVEDLQLWLAVRGNEPGAIFTSLHRGRGFKGEMLNPTALNYILRRRAAEAGVSLKAFEVAKRGNFTPHALRHTAISEVIRADGLAAAQAFARHKNPATTQRYNDDKDTLARAGQRTIAGKLLEQLIPSDSIATPASSPPRTPGRRRPCSAGSRRRSS
jgi:integrase/recombinase XerC